MTLRSVQHSSIFLVSTMVFVFLMGCNSKDSNYFNASITHSAKAKDLADSKDNAEAMDSQLVLEVTSLYKKALENAEKVDIQKLNEKYDDLGPIYKNMFISGMKNLIQGYETGDEGLIKKGDTQIKLWTEWYDRNLDNIKRGKK